MSGVVLSLRAALTAPLDLSGVTPDRVVELSQREIDVIEVWSGPAKVALGDLFSIQGERSPDLHLEGDLRWAEGTGGGMTSGNLVVHGAVGARLGARMRGGRIVVHGDAGSDAGQEMGGGVILIEGNAAERAGSAYPGASKGMTGGEIIIRGSAGSETGAQMRRGLIAVGGTAGDYTGRAMIAGSVLVLGTCGQGTGQWSKRGTIVCFAGVRPPATYRLACEYQPPHLRVTLARLRREYRMPFTDRHLTGRYRRYSGDLAEVGKGEILEWIAQ